MPYFTQGPQICCNGQLSDGFTSQCCGGRVVSRDDVCCGDGDQGSVYAAAADKLCCGQQYVNASTSLCCGTGNNAKVHMYSSAAEKASANDRCCGTERISATLSCCHGNGYNPMYQVCADVSETDAGCGSGALCAASQATNAFCNRCNFNRLTTKCGAYTPTNDASDHRDATTTIGVGAYMDEPSDGELCLSELERIYSGLDFSLVDKDLTPYTEYRYSVEAVNGAGVGKSEFASATTSQKLPEGVQVPRATTKPGVLDTIWLDWDPPKAANGELLWYILLRDNIEIFRDPSQRSHMDNNAVQPFRTFTYRLRVCNSVGCVDSTDVVSVATLQAKPEGVVAPTITPESPTSLGLAWPTPSRPNGVLTQYRLLRLPAGPDLNLTADTRQVTVTGLEPYEEYTFVLVACTEAGCTNSTAVTGTTQQDKPTGLAPPVLVVVSSTTAEVHWGAPTHPNGRITAYNVYRTPNGMMAALLASVNGSTTRITDATLTPGMAYGYEVEAVNGAGVTKSRMTTILMPPLTPLGIRAPHNVTALSHSSVYVEWNATEVPNGEIDQYKVLLNAGTEDSIVRAVGTRTSETVSALFPCTLYEVRISACLRGIPNGCGVGPGVTVRTLEAAPEEMGPPALQATGAAIVVVSWQPPSQPNGVITQYRILRRVAGTPGSGLLINLLPGNVLSFSNRGSAGDLLPHTQYEYRVIAVNSRGEADSPWGIVRTLEAPPQELAAPAVSFIAAYSIRLTWTPPQKPNGEIVMYRLEYKIVYDDPTTQPTIESVRVNATTLNTTLSGLRPYTRYDVRVAAVNSAGSVGSVWVRTTTDQAAPANIGLFTIEKMSTGLAVILRWDPPAQPNGVVNNYLVYEDGNVNPAYQGLNRVFEYRKLQPFTEYTVQLEACTSGGCGRSVKQVFTTAEIPPKNQPQPAIADFGSNFVHLRWQPPVNSNGKITKYEVLRRFEALPMPASARRRRALSEPSVVYQTADTDRTEYEYVDTDLRPHTHYEYQIVASNSQGATSSPWQSVDTRQAAPDGLTPPIVSYVNDSYDKLLVRWSPPTSPNGVLQTYRLQRNTSIPWAFSPSDPLQYTDTGLAAFTVYSYTVEACSGGGCTTSVATAMRTRQSAPLYVAPPDVMALHSTALLVTWETPQITNGELRQFRLYMDSSVLLYTGLEQTFTVQNLVPFSQHAFVVGACTAGGCTNSSAVAGRPLEAPPTGMAPPTLTVTSSRSIEVTWQPPEFPNGVITSYEVRRDGTLVFTTPNLAYIDYSVQPGQAYVYNITAFNAQGAAISPPASATTFASSPEGLDPPKLEAMSSTSIKAVWTAPLKPNGLIYNYTLYKDAEPVYSDRGLSHTVTGLQHYTEYSFRIQACTSNGCTTSDPVSARTLEAPPLGLMSPKLTPLADSNGRHSGIQVEWGPPRQTNGPISGYELYRRPHTGASAGETGGPRKLVYSGQEEVFTDTDPQLRPYTQYDYMVAAVNSQGSVASEWQSVLTREAPPQDVPAPTAKNIAARKFTLDLKDPITPNGRIEKFDVYVNGNFIVDRLSYTIEVEYSSINPPVRLQPHTEYTVYIEACTAGGCTASPEVTLRTLAELPVGFSAPALGNVTATAMDAAWDPPTSPNGNIESYEVLLRRSCPFPYADSDDQVTVNCSWGPWSQVAVGRSLFAAHITGLLPYTRYEVKVVVTNTFGSMDDPPVAEAQTLPAAPQYSRPPEVVAQGNELTVDWTRTFYVNGEVEAFYLYVDDNVEYSGFSTSYSLIKETVYKVYELQVKLVTAYGEAESPTVRYDPRADDIGTTTELAPVLATTKPVYEEVWFIVVVALVAVLLIFLLLALVLCRMKRRTPNVRERAPLQPVGHKPKVPVAYCIDPYDGSVITTEIPQPPPPTAMPPGVHPADYPLGYTNPAYSHLSLPSKPGSLVDLNLDSVGSTTKWGAPEDDDEQDTDSLTWLEANLPDSGLHSLAYGDDYDADSDRPVSVLKEHTMFTDTHL